MPHVKYEKREMVGLITFDRQSALNALTGQMLEELDKVLDFVSPDEIRCLIVTGAGKKAFIAGADIDSMRLLSKAGAVEWSRRGNEVFRKLECLCVPVIAAINGYALGGGCELAMACDIRIASENAVFAQPEVSLGITAGFGGTQRLARLIGQGMAKELLYSGTRIDAAEAMRIGLVNHVYPEGQLLEEAFRLAQKIAGNAPIAVRTTKKAINKGSGIDIDSALEAEAILFSECFETQDQRNAMSAFLEKKKPEPFINK